MCVYTYILYIYVYKLVIYGNKHRKREERGEKWKEFRAVGS